MKMRELMITFDVETDGPTPMVNNLLAIGLVGFCGGEEVFAQSYNIKPLEGHRQDEVTMKFWLRFPEIWQKITSDQKDYRDVFKELSGKFFNLAKKYRISFAAGPACFDWMFFKCYYELANENGDFYDIGYKCYCQLTTWNLVKKLKKIPNDKGELIKKRFNHGDMHDPLNDARNQANFYDTILDLAM